MFTTEELNNIGAFLSRANIVGNEAITLVQLQQKVASLVQPAPTMEKVEKKGK